MLCNTLKSSSFNSTSSGICVIYDLMEEGWMFPAGFHMLRHQGASHWGITHDKSTAKAVGCSTCTAGDGHGSHMPLVAAHAHACTHTLFCQLSSKAATMIFACRKYPEHFSKNVRRKPRFGREWKHRGPLGLITSTIVTNPFKIKFTSEGRNSCRAKPTSDSYAYQALRLVCSTSHTGKFILHIVIQRQ